MRIFWSIQHSIRVKEEHDQRPIMRRKSSKSAIKNEEIIYNRQSVHHFGLIGTSKEFSESLVTPKAEEVLEKSILKRTLSGKV